jgi:hypothetical protein
MTTVKTSTFAWCRVTHQCTGLGVLKLRLYMGSHRIARHGEKYRFDFQYKRCHSLFTTTMYKVGLGYFRPPTHHTRATLSRRQRRLELTVTLLSCSEIKNECSFVNTPPIYLHKVALSHTSTMSEKLGIITLLCWQLFIV